MSAVHAQFYAALGRFGPLSGHVFDALVPLLRARTFETGAYLLRAGEVAEWSYFITRGLVRELYIAERGDEHVRAFVAEGQLSGSLLDLISGTPSVTWIQALEPTSVLAFRYREFDQLCDREPQLQRCARRFAELLFVRKARREHAMLALTARQRYAAWLVEEAGLDARIQRRHVASYLGMTPEHLSRLRRGVRG